MSKSEIYFSTDIETDGPAPGINSMLSVGSVAYNAEGHLISTFTVNLETLPYAIADQGTMKWWATQPSAWEACRTDLVGPCEGTKRFYEWVTSIPGSPVFLAYPAGFDFTFCQHYFHKYIGKSPFGFSCLDIKSYAMAVLKSSFRETVKRNFPNNWFSKRAYHSHVAIDDAHEQGELFFNIKKYHENGGK